MIVAWQKEFPKEALEKGFTDYQEGVVTGLKKRPYGFEATVAQSGLETVEIHTEGSSIRLLKCTCGDSRTHGHCRHMAAVLMTLDDMLPMPLTFEVAEDVATVAVTLKMSEELWTRWQSLGQKMGVSAEELMLEHLKNIQ